jgi:signal transduction histidine kinase
VPLFTILVLGVTHFHGGNFGLGGFAPFGVRGILSAVSTSGIYVPEVFERTDKRAVPWFGLLFTFVVGLIVFLPFPTWQKLVGFVTSASVLMYAGAPLAFGVLRRNDPDRTRPFQLPGVGFWSPVAFIVANLIIYWAGFDTLWRLGVAIVLGYLLIGASVWLKLNPRTPRLDFRAAQWLPVYLLGMGILSWQGGFCSTGPAASNSCGATNRLGLGWDILVIAVFSLVIYYWARRSGCPSTEPSSTSGPSRSQPSTDRRRTRAQRAQPLATATSAIRPMFPPPRRRHPARMHAKLTDRSTASQAAYQERLRIAREVHDVVGHGLTVINLQAVAALDGLDTCPDQAEVALEAIRTISKNALEELRAALAVLRQPEGGSSPRPVAGLDQLGALVGEMGAGGLEVELEVSGERPAVSRAVGQAAYRIVQESLTNVLRHAGPGVATVRVRYEPDAVVLEIADEGRGRGANGHGGHGGGGHGGHGISGMRERAAALGGTLEAGPHGEGGFRVRARLPR